VILQRIKLAQMEAPVLRFDLQRIILVYMIAPVSMWFYKE
jgi:hypothetical protein